MGKPVDTKGVTKYRIVLLNYGSYLDLVSIDGESRIQDADDYDVVLAKDHDSALTTAQQRIADLEAQCARVQKLADFGLRCLDDYQTCYSDLDGGWVQDTAVKCGVLVKVTATEPCDPEHCDCASMADFPTTCYRRAPDIRDAAMAAKGDDWLTREARQIGLHSPACASFGQNECDCGAKP